MHARFSPPLSLAYSSAEYKLPTAARERHVHGPCALSAARTTRQYARQALKLNPFASFFSLQAVAVRAAIGALRWSLTLLECAPQCAQPRQVDRARVLAFLGFFLSEPTFYTSPTERIAVGWKIRARAPSLRDLDFICFTNGRRSRDLLFRSFSSFYLPRPPLFYTAILPDKDALP